MRSRLGYNQATIAVAHKLARIVFKMVSSGVEYDESIDREKNYNMLTLKRNYLQKKLAKLEKEISLSACFSNNLV
jgi:hypothetical protein